MLFQSLILEIEGSLAFCALMLFQCVLFVFYVFWEYFACGVYLAFWGVVFVFVENDVCEDGVCRCVCLVGFEYQRKQPLCL